MGLGDACHVCDLLTLAETGGGLLPIAAAGLLSTWICADVRSGLLLVSALCFSRLVVLATAQFAADTLSGRKGRFARAARRRAWRSRMRVTVNGRFLGHSPYGRAARGAK